MADYDDKFDLILDEVRSLRADFNAFSRNICERVATLEAHDHNLYGNGQPGRVSVAEDALQQLQLWRWWVVGAGAGVGAMVSIVGWLVAEAGKR